jgi:OmcA/MtrC family decaheme c-type cytochrome
MYFAPGEKPILTLRLTDRCGRAIQPGDLGTANLYVAGPRQGSATKTAIKLLNCITDRMAADHQHHAIFLSAPHYADPTQNNLSIAADGALAYQLAAITDEPPGTYTAGLWATSKDDKDQALPTVEFQIGTATREEYATGPSQTSSCYDCHLGPASGKSYQAHIAPGYAPFGNYALDQAPIANCKLCHNNDGYSPNPTVRKAHSAHRGSKQTQAGMPHAEYGLGADSSLADYLDVTFPSMPGHDLDCDKCHKDDRWKTAPSRMACGTCHDNLYYDTGLLTPPIVLGQPSKMACVMDADCAVFGNSTGCNTTTGMCERRGHPAQADDSQCATCHSADNTGLSPIPAAHEIYARTRTRGLRIQGFAASGGSGANGAFNVGDTPTITFQLVDQTGAAVTDLATNKALSPSVVVAGPTDDRQRIYGPLSMKTTGTLSFNNGNYTYVFPAPIPAQAIAPYNTTQLFGRPNSSGTYTMWLWIVESLTVQGQSVRGVASFTEDFALGQSAPLLPRQVISAAACDACHVDTQAHGGSRAGDATTCSMCHTRGAVDRTAGSKGAPCTQTAQCGGGAAGWETCQDTNNDGTPDTCLIANDPTPGQPIDFAVLIHDIHFARLRSGYAERNNLVNPGDLTVIGYMNSVNDFSDILFPQDVRNCTKCHEDNGAACSSSAPCGVGQACTGGKCVNRAWVAPSGRVCLSCHDSAAATGHVMLNTWSDASGPVETCDVCHAETAQFAVEKVHDIANPYVPPYGRLP